MKARPLLKRVALGAALWTACAVVPGGTLIGVAVGVLGPQRIRRFLRGPRPGEARKETP